MFCSTGVQCVMFCGAKAQNIVFLEVQYVVLWYTHMYVGTVCIFGIKRYLLAKLKSKRRQCLSLGDAGQGEGRQPHQGRRH